jgi:hypothetical protein
MSSPQITNIFGLSSAIAEKQKANVDRKQATKPFLK